MARRISAVANATTATNARLLGSASDNETLNYPIAILAEAIAASGEVERVMSLASFGAVSGGVTNAKTAVDTAFAAAIAAGCWLSGDGLTYGVSGNVTIPTGLKLRDVTFKQLDPNPSGRKTLYASSVNNVRLQRVKVDRNGTGANGDLNSSGGIWIQGGSGHLLEDCEVYGDDIGSGIVMWQATDSMIVRPYCHDIGYVLAAPSDDQVHGIWLSDCTRVQVVNPRCVEFASTLGGSPSYRWSRAIILGGCTDCDIIAPIVRNADQGIDFTGSSGNIRCHVLGGHIDDCYTVGVKHANSAVDCKVTGVTVSDPGWVGFICQGPSESGLTYVTERVTYTDCKAIRPGSSGVWTSGGGNPPTGFYTFPGAFDTDHPKGVSYYGCEAIDDDGTPTMVYGFRNTVTGASPRNIHRNCRSVGHTTAAFDGFLVEQVRLGVSVGPSIPNATDTAIAWTVENADQCGWHAANSATVTVDEDGLYLIVGQVGWVGNTTGMREISIEVGGTELAETQVRQPGASNDTVMQTTCCRWLSASTAIRMLVNQGSGGSLGTSATFTSLSVTKLTV